MLKDNRRVEVPVDPAALQAAIANVQWAVSGIVSGDFPMRPELEKCRACDFRQLCPMTPQQFLSEPPEPLQVPGAGGGKLVAAFDQFDEAFSPEQLNDS